MSSSFQSKVYECSANNASVRISNSEWINEFSDGIELDVGDTVRVLGSFIQEKGAGDTIEIAEDIDFNLGFMPYVTAETLKFHIATAGEDTQINLGMFAQPVWATDNLGVEPPCMPGFTTIGAPATLPLAVLYKGKPRLAKATGSTSDGDLSIGLMNGQGDIANYVGWEEDCINGKDWVAHPDAPGSLDSGFNNLSIPREFYISSLCKRLTVPIFHGLRYRVWSNDPPVMPGTNDLYGRDYTFDPTRAGGLEWRAGDFIGTYFISGYIDGSDATNTSRELKEATTIANFGTPRWAAGPRSVVGKILNIRETTISYNQYDVGDTLPGEVSLPLGRQDLQAYEMYVWDFVNPASYKRYNSNDSNAYYRHGSGELKNNYSNYPQNNNLNGLTYCCAFRQFQGESTGQGTYMGNLLQAPHNDCIEYQTTNMLAATKSQQRLGYTNNTGLSFLWANKGFDCDPNGYNNTPGFAPRTQDCCGSWMVCVDATPQKNYWECQPFTSLAASTAVSMFDHRYQHPMLIHGWTEIGAIVRIEDINDDNTASSWLGANQIPFLGIPFTKQEAKSNYVTAFQNNSFDEEQVVLGTKCGLTCPAGFGEYKGPGPGVNRKEPWASGIHLTNTIPDIGWGNNMAPTVPVPGSGETPTTAVKGGWCLQNYGNDANCSIHLQTKSGDMIFKQEPTINKVWNEDLMIIKKYKFQITLPKGYYSVTEMAQTLNDQLHYTTGQYKEKIGNFTTVGVRERQLPPNPSVVHGNFIHTYLPDITYGIFPITQQIADEDADMAALGVNFDPLDTLLTYETAGGVGVNVLDGIEDVVVANFPYTHTAAGGGLSPRPGGNCCFRFIGGKLDADGTTLDNDQYTYGNNLGMFFAECKNDYYEPNNPSHTESYNLYSYPSRGYYNNFSFGGSSKIWIGCPNPTFSWDDALQKFYFESLYTPIRPVQAEKTGAPELSAGEADPSVVINVDSTGTRGEELGGVYITNLADTKITKSELLQPDILDYPNDTYYQALTTVAANNAVYQAIGQNFWDEIGFSLTGIQAQMNTYSFPNNPYLYEDVTNVYGITIRNFPDVDIAVNGANPFKSRCTTIAPYNQFFVAIDSDEFLADITPRLSNNPFYLIGSDLPTKHYHGGRGTKLPVIGICGRNYARFSYVFDLSESSIMYTVNAKTIVQSIRTKIYLNNMKEADNLQPNSSVVYIVQKTNYAPQMNPQQLQQALEKYMKENATQPKVPASYYYYQNQLDYQLPNPYQEQEDTDEDE